MPLADCRCGNLAGNNDFHERNPSTHAVYEVPVAK